LDCRADADHRRVINGKVDRLALADLKVLRNIVRRMFNAGAHSMASDPSVPTGVVWNRKVGEAKKEMVPDKGAMKMYFSSGKGGETLKKLVESVGDKRRRHDLRYMTGE
jgi:hypothetical protein